MCMKKWIRRINFFGENFGDARERNVGDLNGGAAMIFADLARDIGRRATGHETIRGESFLGFGDVPRLDVAVA